MAMGSARRSNEQWLAHLSSLGPDKEAALSDLRTALMRGLRRALSSWDRADEAFREDAVQDSLLRILDRIQQFEGRSGFLTWATAIAIRVAVSELRRRRWKDVSLDEAIGEGRYAPAVAVDGRPGPEAEWKRKAILDTVYSVIQSELTEKQRSALLAELRGMPQGEIARHLGSNRNAVYKLTHDARKSLKRGLEAAGYEAADVQAVFSS